MDDTSRRFTCGQVIRKWERIWQKDASTQKTIHLPYENIGKMDGSLADLRCCENLHLSTNSIRKIENIGNLTNLKVLTLDNNLITSLDGLLPLRHTLRSLSICNNEIESLEGIQFMRNLTVLHMRGNPVRSWREFVKLQRLKKLRKLSLSETPLRQRYEVARWREIVAKRLPRLEKLDYLTINDSGIEIDSDTEPYIYDTDSSSEE